MLSFPFPPIPLDPNLLATIAGFLLCIVVGYGFGSIARMRARFEGRQAGFRAAAAAFQRMQRIQQARQ